MQVQKISSPSFGALIRIKKTNPEELAKKINQSYQNLPDGAKVASGSLFSSSSTGITTAVPLANTTGLGSYTTGTAFIAHGMDINSFGIYPSALDKIAVTATPATVNSSAEYPALAGSIFSTIGAKLQEMFKLKFKFDSTKKIPS